MNRLKKLEGARGFLSRARFVFVLMEIVGLIGLAVAFPSYQEGSSLWPSAFAAMIYAGMLGILLWAGVNLMHQWMTNRQAVIDEAENITRWLGKAKWAFVGMILLGGAGLLAPQVQENARAVYHWCEWFVEIGLIGLMVWAAMLGVRGWLRREYSGKMR